MKLFTPYKLGNIELKNRIVMSPMTRNRAIDNVPNDLMAEYYRQRSNAGLIITEGTAPSPNGLGYARMPGIYSAEQVQGWKKVTRAVHENDGKIFLQIMHTGRASHTENMSPGSKIFAPSAVALDGEIYTDSKGMQPYPTPNEMTLKDIEQAQKEFILAAENAIKAGFDGVEIHGANGYLIDQFINTASNKRDDAYGGSKEYRSRFAIEIAQKIAAAIGSKRTAIRLSPYGLFNGMEIFDELEETFEYIAKELGKIDLAYIHVVDHSSMGAPEVKDSVKVKIKNAFAGTFIDSGGMSKEKAESILNSEKADLIAFGRDYLANPDLAIRLKYDLELNKPDFSTFYTPGEKGYIDYPTAKVAELV